MGYARTMNTQTLRALAEPNRFRIVELLRDQPCSVGEIAERLSLLQPQVSKHLRVLSEAGLAEARPAAQLRIYHLRGNQFRELDSWLASFRQSWEDRLESLDDYLKVIQAQQCTKRGEEHRRRRDRAKN